ncbi:MAG: hypothetical protein GXY32_11145 [Ruminococcaceae bacterium]|nr:hypothetical protein [Oscillospiraceae bacterium]
MITLAAALGDVINLPGLLLAVPLVAVVLLAAWLIPRRRKKRRAKPGQFLVYAVPGKTAAQCRQLLATPLPDDLFAYSLESAKPGASYLHFTRHLPTQQPLDTLFLLQFEADFDARFSLRFVREAFGMREPIIPEDLLDAFFAQKLGAVRDISAPATS